jgi:hypothetical protein
MGDAAHPRSAPSSAVKLASDRYEPHRFSKAISSYRIGASRRRADCGDCLIIDETPTQG